MNDLATLSSALATLDGVNAVEAACQTLPNLDAPVLHHFAPGIYVRELHMAANPADPTLAIGRSHRAPCLNILLKGKLALRNDDGSWREIAAPFMFVGSAGRKVAIVLEDTVFQNLWATQERDVATIERAMFDDTDAFLAAQDARIERERPKCAADVDDFLVCGVDLDVSGWCDPFPYGAGTKVAVWPSPIWGNGLFASAPIVAGEVIGPLRGDEGGFTPAARAVNHSKTPNAAFVGSDLVALRPIRGCRGGDHGEEVTIDYRAAVDVLQELRRGET